MAFSKPIPGNLVGSPLKSVWIAAAVIPMGWISAVSLFQHIQQQLSLRPVPRGAGLLPVLEWRRDAALPLPCPCSEEELFEWFQHYLDDFDAPVIVSEKVLEQHIGKPSSMLVKRRTANKYYGVETSEVKAVEGELVAERMGALVDGGWGRVGVCPRKILLLIHFGLFIVAADVCNCKALAIFCGRTVRCFEFRRPLMSTLNDIWKYMNWRGYTRLTNNVLIEILICISLLPMAFTDMRVQIDDRLTCSDASMSGGGMCVTTGLTPHAYTALRAANSLTGYSPLNFAFAPETTLAKKPVRVLCVGLFDGMGALRVALSRLEPTVLVVAYVSSEILGPAKRVVRKRWPGVIEWGSVLNISTEMVDKLMQFLLTRIDVVIIGGGSPCQDLSSLNAHRVGLSGEQSRLFYQIPRIIEAFRKFSSVPVHFLVENVASMKESEIPKFSKALGVSPYLLDARDFSHAIRRRLYWCSWPVLASVGCTIAVLPLYSRVKVECKVPCAESWLDADCRFDGKYIPTLTRALPSASPGTAPAGLNKASEKAKERWRADDHCFQVYNYEDHVMVHDSSLGALRVPSAEEAEQLMGFDKFYSVAAVKEKPFEREAFIIRRQLIGNTFNVSVVSFLLAELLVNEEFVTSRFPMDTFTKRGTCELPFADVEQDSSTLIDDKRASLTLVHEYLRIAEKGGSDVRLDIGLPYRAGAWPRASARAHLWHWEIVHGYPWKSSEGVHINKLELLAVVNSVKWRLRSWKQQRCKFIHLVDSQVCGAILAKGRTSSKVLRPSLKKLSALLIAAGAYPSYIYIYQFRRQSCRFALTLEMAKREQKKKTDKQKRVAKRHKKGSLKSQQLMPRVFWRYERAFARLLAFWMALGTFIGEGDTIDEPATEYIEALYQEGSPLSTATDTLAALQYFMPNAAGRLKEAWRMCRIWRRVEPPTRCRPFSPIIVLGLAGAAYSVGAVDVAALLLVGFDVFLRTGEIFALTPLAVSFRKNKAIIKLGETKTSHRKVADEVVIVESGVAVRLLKLACQGRPPGLPILTLTPAKTRQLLKTLLGVFGLEDWGFNFYSLRRGGATSFFFKSGSMEKTLAKGRWETASTARIYIHDAAAQTGELTLSPQQRDLLEVAAKSLRDL